MNEPDQRETAAPAVGAPLDCGVGRPVEKRLGARVWHAYRRLVCKHTHGHLVAIEWDGEAVYECIACGKDIRRPLA